MKLHEAVTRRILDYCIERDIKPNALCNMSGVIQSTLNKIFSGKSKNPTTGTIKNLCFGLNISLSQFFDCEYFDNLDD